MVRQLSEGGCLASDWPARSLFIAHGGADTLILPTSSFLLCVPITLSQTKAATSFSRVYKDAANGGVALAASQDIADRPTAGFGGEEVAETGRG